MIPIATTTVPNGGLNTTGTGNVPGFGALAQPFVQSTLPKPVPTAPTNPGVATSDLATTTVNNQKVATNNLVQSVNQQTAKVASTPTFDPTSSVTDLLTSKGQPSDFASRAKLANQAGIQGYIGTPAQNQQLMGFINNPPAPAPNTTSSTGTTTTTPTSGTTSPATTPVVTASTDQNAPTASTTTTPPATVNTGSPGDAYNSQIDDVQTQLGQNVENFASQVQQIYSGTFPLSAAQQSLLTATQAQFNEVQALQLTANKSYQGMVALAGNREGLNIQNPSEYAATQNQAITDGLNKINNLDATATKTLATLQEGFMNNDYQMINDTYTALQKTLEDKQTALEDVQKRTDDLYTFTQDFNQKAQEFQQQQAKETQEFTANFNAKYGGFLDHQTGLLKPGASLATTGLQETIPGAGAVIDTNSASFKALPAGVQRLVLQNNKGITIDSGTPQGKNFSAAANAVQGLNASITNGQIDGNTPIWKALGLPRSTFLGIGTGYKRGDDPSTALGLSTPLGLSPNASVNDVITALNAQMATAAGVSPATLQLNNYLQSNQSTTDSAAANPTLDSLYSSNGGQ